MDVNHEDMIAMLQNIVRMLALIPTEALEKHVEDNRSHLGSWDSIGSMIDPTAYRDALHSGRLEDAQNQLEITKYLLLARRSIDVREAFVAEKARGRT